MPVSSIHMCQMKKKNRKETTGRTAVDISDWVRGGLKCPLKAPASSGSSAVVSDVSPHVGGESKSHEEHSESLARS